MIGVTNAIETKTEYTTDDHTIFLMTDSLEDKSKHHWLVTQRNVLVLDNNARQRDGRPSIWFDPRAQGMIVIPMECARTGTADWTIEYWFRCGLSVAAAAVYHQRHSSGTQYGFSLGDGGVTPNRGLFMGNAAGSGWAISGKGMGTAQTLGVWRHYAVVRANNVIYRFENGILIGTDNYTVSISEPSINPVFGAYNYNAVNLDCTIQDFRISDIARYTANFTPPERFI